MSRRVKAEPFSARIAPLVMLIVLAKLLDLGDYNMLDFGILDSSVTGNSTC